MISGREEGRGGKTERLPGLLGCQKVNLQAPSAANLGNRSRSWQQHAEARQCNVEGVEGRLPVRWHCDLESRQYDPARSSVSRQFEIAGAARCQSTVENHSETVRCEPPSVGEKGEGDEGEEEQQGNEWSIQEKRGCCRACCRASRE